jgi:arsenate reductase-like glutaredoxin family protein
MPALPHNAAMIVLYGVPNCDTVNRCRARALLARR